MPPLKKNSPFPSFTNTHTQGKKQQQRKESKDKHTMNKDKYNIKCKEDVKI